MLVAGDNGEDGRLLAASRAVFGTLPRVAAGLRGGGWARADVGHRVAAGDVTLLPRPPVVPIATDVVTLVFPDWIAQFPTHERHLFLSGDRRHLLPSGERPQRAGSSDVGGYVSTAEVDLSANAIVAGTVYGGATLDVLAAGYAGRHAAAVRVVFSDGAWLQVPARAMPEGTERIWAVQGRRRNSDSLREIVAYEAVDSAGDVLARVPVVRR